MENEFVADNLTMLIQQEKKILNLKHIIINEYEKYGKKEHIEIIEKAFDYSVFKHAGQKRLNGDMYVLHPIYVAIILIDLKYEYELICAALLHDTIEDTKTTFEELKNIFGKNIARFVKYVTKIGRLYYVSKSLYQTENFRKMVVAMSKDIRVIVLKLADRLHNMRTFECVSNVKKILICAENFDIYIPIAEMFGMYSFKSEIEDLTFKYTNPKFYYKIASLVLEKKQQRERKLKIIIIAITKILKKEGIISTVAGRVKNFYSIYKKFFLEGKKKEIYDMIAVRIIAECEKDCYIILGLVHKNFKPFFSKYKDYIAVPKKNLYQSLHTTVYDKNGFFFEVQIRTIKMDEKAKNGFASHYIYKKNSSSAFDKVLEKNFSFFTFKKIFKYLEETKSKVELNEVKSLTKIDALFDSIFVYCNNGEVLQIAKKTTVLDLFSNIDKKNKDIILKIKVNNVFVEFDRELKNGDLIEIIKKNKKNNPLHVFDKGMEIFNTILKERHYIKSNDNVQKLCLSENKFKKRYFKPEVTVTEESINERSYKYTIIKNGGDFVYRSTFLIVANENFLFKKIIEYAMNEDLKIVNLYCFVYETNILNIFLKAEFGEKEKIIKIIEYFDKKKEVISIITRYQ